jgi:hypothetical protein
VEDNTQLFEQVMPIDRLIAEGDRWLCDESISILIVLIVFLEETTVLTGTDEKASANSARHDFSRRLYDRS